MTHAPASPRAARRAIEARARELGFDALGICAADRPPEASRFEEWLSRGFHGRMAWIERSKEKRLDPARVLPGARSILVGAVRYAPQSPPPRPALSGRVSCYAWGDDYHLVVGEKAAGLAAFIREGFGARALDYVDTGPILERLYAARAGVGWIGKNAMALSKDLGSYFFIAVVLTDLDLPRDEPAADQCGSCTLCIEACPTGAIVEPRTVDSRLCLSYHTIELRGAFPAEHRVDLGDRAFGCDDCQEACPWNGGPIRPPERLLPRGDEGAPDLVGLLGMDIATYTRRFRGSAMKRATREGLRRNAAVALGNVLAGERGDAAGPGETPAPAPRDRDRALRALQEAAESGEPAVADAARWALRRSASSSSA